MNHPQTEKHNNNFLLDKLNFHTKKLMVVNMQNNITLIKLLIAIKTGAI